MNDTASSHGHTAPNTELPKKKKKGCFFYGCLGVVVLCVAGMGGMYYLWRTMRAEMQELVSDAPREIAVSDSTPEDYWELKRRYETFKTAAEKQEVAELVVTADDLNTMIAQDPSLAAFKDNVAFRIDKGHLIVEASVPLEQFGKGCELVLQDCTGKYFNGSAVLAAGVTTDGKPDIRVQAFEAKGKGISGLQLDQVSKHNVVDELRKRKVVKGDSLQGLSSIQITDDGKIILKTGKLPAEEETP